MENMYGSIALNQKYLTARTCTIEGDKDGVLEALLRLIVVGLRLENKSISSLLNGSTIATHELWIRAIEESEHFEEVDLTDLARVVTFEQYQSILACFNAAIQSLPPQIELYCFAQRCECSCGEIDNVIASFDKALKCSGCGRHMDVVVLPKIAIVTEQRGLYFSEETGEYELLSACASKQGACSQLFCDIFSNNREMAYLLHTVKRNETAFQIPDPVYLDCEKATQWIMAQGSKAAEEFGFLEIFFYYDMEQVNVTTPKDAQTLVNHNMLSSYEISPTSKPHSSSILKTPKYLESPLLDAKLGNSPYRSDVDNVPLAVESSASSLSNEDIPFEIEEYEEPPHYTYRTISIFDLQPIMFLLLLGVVVLLVINVVLASVLTWRIENTLPIRNLAISEKAFFGVDPTENLVLPVKEADLTLYRIVTQSIHAIELDVGDISSTSAVFSELETPSATLPNEVKSLRVEHLRTNTFDSRLFRSETILNFTPGIEAEGLDYSTVTYDQFASTGTLQTENLNTTSFESTTLTVAEQTKTKVLLTETLNVLEETNANTTVFNNITITASLEVNGTVNVETPLLFDGQVSITNRLLLNNDISILTSEPFFQNSNLSLIGETILVNSELNLFSLETTIITTPEFVFKDSECKNCNTLNVSALMISNQLYTEEFVQLGVSATISDFKATNTSLSAINIGSMELNANGLFGENATISFGGVNISGSSIASISSIIFSSETILNASEIGFANQVTADAGTFRNIGCRILAATTLRSNGNANCSIAAVQSLSTSGNMTLGQVMIASLRLKVQECATIGMLCNSRLCDLSGCKIFEHTGNAYILRGDIITGDLVCHEDNRAGPLGGCWE